MKLYVCAFLSFLLVAQPGYAESDPACAGQMGTETSTPPRAPAKIPTAQADVSNWQLGFALGYGERSNPLVQSDDIPLVLDLDIGWFGEQFFFDNGDLGFTFADNDYVTASLVARANSDRVFFGRTNTRFVSVDLAGQPLATAVELVIPDRDYAIELGFEVLADGDWGQLAFAAHQDISGTHDGFEVLFDYSYGWRSQRWYLSPSIGFKYKSDAMNDYYWGVSPAESSTALPSYTASAGTNVHARLQFSYQLTQHWAFSMVGEVERLNDEAAASPIVADKNVVGYFAGFGYRF